MPDSNPPYFSFANDKISGPYPRIIVDDANSESPCSKRPEEMTDDEAGECTGRRKDGSVYVKPKNSETKMTMYQRLRRRGYTPGASTKIAQHLGADA